eukprot:9480074-Pyramimonas_sp.AAC.2
MRAHHLVNGVTIASQHATTSSVTSMLRRSRSQGCYYIVSRVPPLQAASPLRHTSNSIAPF